MPLAFFRLFFLFVFPVTLVFSRPIEKRVFPQQMKTSVIIPCFYGHFKHLPFLLSLYTQQSVIPDEVIIALSEVEKVDERILSELENTKWPFVLKIIKNISILYAGENRNIASEAASHEIHICQDADDIPHPQRVEIIKYFFENYKIDYLLHEDVWQTWGKNAKRFEFSPYEKESIEFSGSPNGFAFHFNTAWGCPSYSKELFGRVKWTSLKRGQDSKFYVHVRDAKSAIMCIHAVLNYYRPLLSSGRF